MKHDIKKIKKEMQEMFNIYLDSDIAGDNKDRRQKLLALEQTFEILDEK